MRGEQNAICGRAQSMRGQMKTIYQAILDSLPDGVYVMDQERRFTYWNPCAERIAGHRSEELLGRRCCDTALRLVDEEGAELCNADCPIQAVLAGQERAEADVYMLHSRGHVVPVRLCVVPLRDPEGHVMGAIGTFQNNARNVSALARLRELEQTATHDPLTGLANRRFVQQHLQDCLNLRSRYGWSFGVLFMDVDDLKGVNDTHGHSAGDALLQAVAATLAKHLRSFDMVGRWGGDEFLVVCPHLDANQLATMAERQRALIAHASADVAGTTLHTTVSIGATLPRPSESLQELLQRADSLMYNSKRGGRNQVTVAP